MAYPLHSHHMRIHDSFGFSCIDKTVHVEDLLLIMKCRVIGSERGGESAPIGADRFVLRWLTGPVRIHHLPIELIMPVGNFFNLTANL